MKAGRILISFAAALLFSMAVLAVMPDTAETAAPAEDSAAGTDCETCELAVEEIADAMETAAETADAMETAAEIADTEETGTKTVEAIAETAEIIWTVTWMQDDVELGSEAVSDGSCAADIPETGADGQLILFWLQDGAETDPAEFPITQDTVFTAVTVSILNTDSHTAYAAGISPGLFGPNESLTRAEAAQMLYGLLAYPVEGPVSCSYTDLDPDSAYFEAVMILSSQGILTGYEDGTFRPDDAVTRSEMVTIMARFFQLEAGENPFPDVPEDHWAFVYIRSAASRGWLSGYDDGTFHPDDPITRAEAVALINAALGRSAEAGETAALLAESTPCIYVDVSPEDPFYLDVLEATTDHTCTMDAAQEVWTDLTLTDCGLEEGVHQIGEYFYYVNSDLQFASPDPGTALLDGKLYYVNSAGSMPVLSAGVRTLGSELYCVLDDGTLAFDTQVGELYFGSDGAYTSGSAELDAMVQAALAQCTETSMTQAEKLRAAYVYVRDSFTYLSRTHVAHGTTDWAEEYAVWMFTYGKGNCYCFAAAFMYMARQLGYDATVVSGSIYLFGSVIDHGWTMIDDLIYDVETEYAYLYRYSARASYNLYGMSRSAALFSYYFP